MCSSKAVEKSCADGLLVDVGKGFVPNDGCSLKELNASKEIGAHNLRLFSIIKVSEKVISVVNHLIQGGEVKWIRISQRIRVGYVACITKGTVFYPLGVFD